MALWRREFLGLGLTLAALGGGDASAAPLAGPRPTDERQDAWLDQGGRRHRTIFDTASAKGAGESLIFADNFYAANEDGYGIAAKELSVVIIFRHDATVFGFNDAAWSKYSSFFSDWGQLDEIGIKSPPTANLYATNPAGIRLPSGGRTLNSLSQRGARFAVCDVATRKLAAVIAKKTGADVNAVAEDMTANLVPNALMVPAGIVALNRAQERGYTVSCEG